MKKIIMTLALVLTVAFISTNAMAWGMNGGHGNGYNMNHNNGVNSQVDPQVYQDFLNSTVKIRAAIDADRAEIVALMASPTPDAKRVRALTEQINEKLATLNQKAITLNLPTYGMMGRGMVGRGMVGFNGNNNGYGCNW